MEDKFVRQWEHGDSPLLWLEMMFIGDTKKMKKFLGFSFGGHYFLNYKQTAIFYKNLKIAKEASIFGAKMFSKTKFVNFFCRQSKEVENELLLFTQKIVSADLHKKTNKEIKEMFENFFDLFSSLYGYYRASRSDFYQVVIDRLRKKMKKLTDNEFASLLGGNFEGVKINNEIKKDIINLKKIGERRYVMHESWDVAYSRAKFLFKEIGLRLNLTLSEVMNCTSGEISRSLICKSCINKNKIQKRMESFKFLYLEKGFRLISPAPKSQDFDKISVSKLSGIIAFGGKVRGRVVIIQESLVEVSKKIIKKITSNSILVTVMTSPDMVPVIKKVSAIITDEGGLLCHAAILAREFKKPCIVSTKLATKVFKDGDLVEVDAEKGIVRKI